MEVEHHQTYGAWEEVVQVPESILMSLLNKMEETRVQDLELLLVLVSDSVDHE